MLLIPLLPVRQCRLLLIVSSRRLLPLIHSRSTHINTPTASTPTYPPPTTHNPYNWQSFYATFPFALNISRMNFLGKKNFSNRLSQKPPARFLAKSCILGSWTRGTHAVAVAGAVAEVAVEVAGEVFAAGRVAASPGELSLEHTMPQTEQAANGVSHRRWRRSRRRRCRDVRNMWALLGEVARSLTHSLPALLSPTTCPLSLSLLSRALLSTLSRSHSHAFACPAQCERYMRSAVANSAAHAAGA